jgi:hypothetical protein
MAAHQDGNVPITEAASIGPNVSPGSKSKSKDAASPKDSGLVQGDEALGGENVIYAIPRYATEDEATIERRKKEFEEFFRNPVYVGDGDENDPANPYFVEKYGDQLPMKWRDDGELWELWLDTLGRWLPSNSRSIQLMTKGRFYYLNTITKEVKYSLNDSDYTAVRKNVVQAQAGREGPSHVAQD